MIVWFEQGSSKYTEYTQMRSIKTKYEYYDMIMIHHFLRNELEKLFPYVIFHYTIYYFILCMRQEPNPLIVSPLTLKI